MCLVSCDLGIGTSDSRLSADSLAIQRFDRVEARFLTTGDFSALQQMNITYPMETRALVEDVLDLGPANTLDFRDKFFKLYQDTLLQKLINDTEAAFTDMSDINRQMLSAFARFHQEVPDATMPSFYAQIGAFTQSIVVDGNSIGISLDKYLGVDYPAYQRFYDEEQRKTMTPDYIVPDCMVFYLMSKYPLEHFDQRTKEERDIHLGTVLYIANKMVGKRMYDSPLTKTIEDYVKRHTNTTVKMLIENTDYSVFDK